MCVGEGSTPGGAKREEAGDSTHAPAAWGTPESSPLRDVDAASDEEDLSGGGYMPCVTPGYDVEEEEEMDTPLAATPVRSPDTSNISVTQLLRATTTPKRASPTKTTHSDPFKPVPEESCPVLRFPAKKIMERMQQRELQREKELMEKARESAPVVAEQPGQRRPNHAVERGDSKLAGWRVSSNNNNNTQPHTQGRTVSSPVPSSEVRTPAMRRRHQLQHAEQEKAEAHNSLFSYKPIKKGDDKDDECIVDDTDHHTNAGRPERYYPGMSAYNGTGQGGGAGLPASVKALRMAEREAREVEREKQREVLPPPPPNRPSGKVLRARKKPPVPAEGRGVPASDQTPQKEKAPKGRAGSPTADADDAAPASPKDTKEDENQTPSKVPSRHRDLMMGLRKKRGGKTKDRVKVYINPAAAKMVVLNAMNTCRFEFAPLRDGANLLWVTGGISVEAAKSLVDEKQRINRFPGMKDLCNKVLFTRHLNRMSALFPEDFEFYPGTYCLPGDEEELHHLISSNSALKKKNRKKIDANRPIWICKPSRGRQGTGIFLTQDLSDVVGEKGAAFNSEVEYVVQRYIERPLLIDGLKFDLRLYVVVLGVDPLRIYLYEEGLARFATNKYKPMESHSMHDAYMHLTNYSLNKDSENFVANSEADGEDVGSKRSIKSVKKWLASEGHDAEKVWEGINVLVNNTMLALQPSLQLNVEAISKPGDDNFKCFQILGFDVMFDADLKPWLLEINAGPSLEASSPLDQAVKEPLVISALRLGTFGLMPRVRPSLKKAFEAGHFGALTQIFPSASSHVHEHLVLFNKELRACFEAACGLKGEMTASRFCRFFREAGVIRSFKQLGHDSRKQQILRVDEVPQSVAEKAPIYSTNKAFELRKRMMEGKSKADDSLVSEEDFDAPDGYEPRYGLKQFNIDIPSNLIDKVRTLTQPELELLFLKKLKMKEGSTGLSFFEFINIVVEMAMHSYKAKEFDQFTLLQKLRLFIPSKKDEKRSNSALHVTPNSTKPPQNLKELLTAKPI